MTGITAMEIAADGRPALVVRPSLTPGPGQVVVSVAACGICGSDLHMVEAGRLAAGTVLGHEFAGTIAEVGDDVPARRTGERVVVRPHTPCSTCSVCRTGAGHLCPEAVTLGIGLGVTPGAFAQQVLVDAAAALPIPADLSFAAAALAEPLAVALHGIALADGALSTAAESGEIVVVGGGPIGLLVALALEALGHDDVVLVETGAGRAAHARGCGVRVRDLPNGSARVVFQCAGASSATTAALDLASFGATVILLGVSHDAVLIPQTRCIFKEITLRGAFGYRAEHFDRAVGLLARGTIRLDDVVTVQRPLAELPQLLDELRHHGTSQVKALILP